MIHFEEPVQPIIQSASVIAKVRYWLALASAICIALGLQLQSVRFNKVHIYPVYEVRYSGARPTLRM